MDLKNHVFIEYTMDMTINKNIIASRFKTTLIDFIDELIEQFPSEPELVIIRVLLQDQMPIETILDKFSEKVLPQKPMIESRDVGFFDEDNNAFKHFHSERGGKLMARLWNSSELDDDNKQIIWQWFDTLLRLVEMYTHDHPIVPPTPKKQHPVSTEFKKEFKKENIVVNK